MAVANLVSKDTAVELKRLLATMDSIHQCINVISDADNSRVIERRSIFEDVTLADDAYKCTISTVGDLVNARRVNLTGRSRNDIGGQISNKSYHRTSKSFHNTQYRTVNMHPKTLVERHHFRVSTVQFH